MTPEEKKMQEEIWRRLQFGVVEIICINGNEFVFHLN